MNAGFLTLTHIGSHFQDGLLGLKGPLICPESGPNLQLEGLTARIGNLHGLLGLATAGLTNNSAILQLTQYNRLQPFVVVVGRSEFYVSQSTQDKTPIKVGSLEPGYVCPLQAYKQDP